MYRYNLSFAVMKVVNPGITLWLGLTLVKAWGLGSAVILQEFKNTPRRP